MIVKLTCSFIIWFYLSKRITSQVIISRSPTAQFLGNKPFCGKGHSEAHAMYSVLQPDLRWILLPLILLQYCFSFLIFSHYSLALLCISNPPAMQNEMPTFLYFVLGYFYNYLGFGVGPFVTFTRFPCLPVSINSVSRAKKNGRCWHFLWHVFG